MVKLLLLCTLLVSCSSSPYVQHMDTEMTKEELRLNFKNEVACEEEVNVKIISQEIDDIGFKSDKNPDRNVRYLKKGVYKVSCGRVVYVCKMWAAAGSYSKAIMRNDCKSRS